jgi:exodeoxyribonuclease VII large subunit
MEMNHFSTLLKNSSRARIRQLVLLLEGLEKNIINMSPINVLKRGYSITTANGVSIKSIKQVKENETIETIVFDGKIDSVITSTKKKHQNE